MRSVLFVLALCLALCVARVWEDDDGTHYDNTEIDIDSEWDPQGAPYYIDGHVYLLGAALTILPGVEVIFNENGTIDANNGTIIAAGTPQKPIFFRAFSSKDDPDSVVGQLVVGEGSFDYCNFVNLESIEGLPDDDSENTFTSCVFTRNSYAATKFRNVNFDSCKFDTNQWTITESSMVSVSSSTFTSSEVCLQGSGLKISLCSFSGCQLAINSDGSEVPLSMDQVVTFDCNTSLAVNEMSDASVTNSNFYNSTFFSTGHFQGKISNNYWGTTNIDEVIAKISWDVDATAVKGFVNPLAQKPFKIDIPTD